MKATNNLSVAADGRNLPVEEVRKFADGRLLLEPKQKNWVLLMKLESLLQGNLPQRWFIIDPKIQPLTLKKKKILGLIPGSKIIEKFSIIFF